MCDLVKYMYINHRNGHIPGIRLDELDAVLFNSSIANNSMKIKVKYWDLKQSVCTVT